MAREIEIKLKIMGESNVVAEELNRFFDVTAWSCSHLVNRYFDTADLALNRAKIALRIREKAGAYIQTLKTAGESRDGMHQRGEWEWNLDAPVLDVECLSELDCWPPGIEADALTCVFETNFERQQAELDWHGARIEVAIDRGWISSPNKQSGSSDSKCEKREPINEIELELLSGSPDSLRDLSEKIRERLSVEYDDISKAQKGYALFTTEH